MLARPGDREITGDFHCPARRRTRRVARPARRPEPLPRMTAAPIRVSMVVLDILHAVENTPSDVPSWGLRLCEQTGYGGGTVYPALDKLLKAGWIADTWEEPQPADRPRRRYYSLTADSQGGLPASANRPGGTPYGVDALAPQPDPPGHVRPPLGPGRRGPVRPPRPPAAARPARQTAPQSPPR